MKKLLTLLILSGLLTACSSQNSSSEKDNYPSKTINWIIPYGTGGGSDQFARNLIQAAKEVDPSYNIVPINMPGAMTGTGLNHFMKQKADGYTIFGNTQDVILTMVQGNSDHKLDDIEPIMRNQHNIDMWFIKSQEDRFQNFDELIEYAKENPGELKVATTGLNGTDAIAIKRMEDHFDVKFKNVPYDEPSERYASLLGGNVDIAHEQPGDVKSFLDNKDYIPVIAMSAEKVRGFENVPLTSQHNLDLTTGFWRGVSVKSGTPPEVVEKLQELFTKAMETESYQKYEKEQYLDIREGILTGEELKKFLEDEYSYLKEQSSQLD